MAIVFKKPSTLTDAPLHYCPGCTHGIIHRLVAEAIEELSQYGGDLTEGSASIILEAGKIISMNVAIEGRISALITQIPVAVGAEFTFD